MKKHIYFTILVGILVGLSSCSMTFEKRLYRKGYHVEVNKTRNQKKQSDDKMEDRVDNQTGGGDVMVTEKSENRRIEETIVTDNSNTTNESPTKDELSGSGKKKEFKKIISRNDDNCDQIVLKDGTSIEAVIVNLGEKEVVYKKCDFPDGPSYTVSNYKIDLIKLRNGDIYRPSGSTSSTTRNSSLSETKTGVGEMVIGILAFIFSLFSMIMSFIAYSGGALVLSYVFGPIGFILGIIGVILSAVNMTQDNFPRTLVGLILSAMAIIMFMVALIILVV